MMLWRSDVCSKRYQLQKWYGRLTSQKRCWLVSVCLSNHDKSVISQKLKYQVKTPSRHNIAGIASFKGLQAFRFFQVCLQFLIFLVSKKQLKLDCTGILRLSLCAVTTSPWPEQKFKPIKSVGSVMRKRNIPLYHQVVKGILFQFVCGLLLLIKEHCMLGTLVRIKIKLSLTESDLTVSPYYL